MDKFIAWLDEGIKQARDRFATIRAALITEDIGKVVGRVLDEVVLKRPTLTMMLKYMGTAAAAYSHNILTVYAGRRLWKIAEKTPRPVQVEVLKAICESRAQVNPVDWLNFLLEKLYETVTSFDAVGATKLAFPSDERYELQNMTVPWDLKYVENLVQPYVTLYTTDLQLRPPDGSPQYPSVFSARVPIFPKAWWGHNMHARNLAVSRISTSLRVVCMLQLLRGASSPRPGSPQPIPESVGEALHAVPWERHNDVQAWSLAQVQGPARSPLEAAWARWRTEFAPSFPAANSAPWAVGVGRWIKACFPTASPTEWMKNVRKHFARVMGACPVPWFSDGDQFARALADWAFSRLDVFSLVAVDALVPDTVSERPWRPRTTVFVDLFDVMAMLFSGTDSRWTMASMNDINLPMPVPKLGSPLTFLVVNPREMLPSHAGRAVEKLLAKACLEMGTMQYLASVPLSTGGRLRRRSLTAARFPGTHTVLGWKRDPVSNHVYQYVVDGLGNVHVAPKR